jgi:hypothetical protein
MITQDHGRSASRADNHPRTPPPSDGTSGDHLTRTAQVRRPVIVPQTFAAVGRHAVESHVPGASDAAVARLNIFNYVGFLVGSPLVGVLGDGWGYRGAMLVPMALVLVTLLYARSFGAEPNRYGCGHERPRTADVGRGSNGL